MVNHLGNFEFDKDQMLENTLPETNSKFAPKNGWLEYYSFLLGFGLFSDAMLVSGRVGPGISLYRIIT